MRLQILKGGGNVPGFQSTHSLRSATESIDGFNNRANVSIHALLAECDLNVPLLPLTISGFNPRTPCGVRQNRPRLPTRTEKFQSTHSLRSATLNPVSHSIKGFRFNPRTPCGVRLVSVQTGLNRIPVSIHALLAECDCAQPYTLLLNKANHTLRQPP